VLYPQIAQSHLGLEYRDTFHRSCRRSESRRRDHYLAWRQGGEAHGAHRAAEGAERLRCAGIREGRASLPIAEWARDAAATRRDFTVELVDLKTWNLPIFALGKPPILGGYEDSLQRRWAASVARADAFLFVAPEYNHSFTPVLKNALDYLNAEWNRKPAAFISYGHSLGARAIEQLALVLLELRMVPITQAVQLRDVYSRVREGYFAADAAEAKRLHAVLDDLSWWAAALKRARSGGRDDARSESRAPSGCIGAIGGENHAAQ
jgi:NAD(P)H-dependent FMN reductase